jgi:hypothetical protein
MFQTDVAHNRVAQRGVAHAKGHTVGGGAFAECRLIHAVEIRVVEDAHVVCVSGVDSVLLGLLEETLATHVALC